MNAFLNTPLRDILRSVAFIVFVGTTLWLPVIVALLRAKP